MAAVKTSPQPSEPSSASSPESSAQFPTQKRKGGRKPVYATQEERKMRNRAAQAAFRERRTEYIKHLEATIKHHEEQLSSLQQSSRNAAEEVLMLRYKTSLLERILLEKGIDVQSELRAFSQSDTPAPTAQMGTVPQQHRPQHSMHQQQMHRQSISRPVQKRGSISQQTPDVIYIKTSPMMQPTPESRATSPNANTTTMPTPPDATSTSTGFIPHSVVSTPASDFVSPGPQSSGCMAIPHTSYYPSPYQAHMEELGKLPLEYEAEILNNNETSPISIDSTPHHPHPHPRGISGNGAHMGGIDHHLAVNLQNGTPPASSGGVGVGHYNVGPPFETLDQLLNSSLEGLTQISSFVQYNLPFTFATSNLR